MQLSKRLLTFPLKYEISICWLFPFRNPREKKKRTILITDVTLKVFQPENSFNIQQILFSQQVMPWEVILRYIISNVAKKYLPRNPLLDFCRKLLPFFFW